MMSDWLRREAGAGGWQSPCGMRERAWGLTGPILNCGCMRVNCQCERDLEEAAFRLQACLLIFMSERRPTAAQDRSQANGVASVVA